ncbi:MAG: 6-phosphofructokinase [Clostridiales bacterium]|jgi:6-phosphofructokinase 1|nr:6-phosphofructokinase [Clostridiales bacterium]
MGNKKIGVMTGGGDCPGLNAVIRAVVKTAIRKYDYEVVGFRDGYRGLVKNDYMPLTERNVSGILDRGGTILGSSNRDNPFKFLIEKNGQFEERDMSERVIENISIHEIDAMVFIGGDGTLTSARDFYNMGVNAVGVPKTIDNDLSYTETTFGFATAVDTATDAIDKLHSTAESHHRVMILEVMGRSAGWIALHAGIAGGADVILIPEIPYKLDNVVKSLQRRKNLGKSFSIVVVAEGAKPEGGDIVVSKIVENSPDPVRLGGIGNKVGSDIETIMGIETRVTVLGHLQRGGRTNAADRVLSTRYGVAAVDLVHAEKFGQMVCLKGSEISSVSIADAVGTIKNVDVDGELIRTAKSVGIEFGAE